jgi:hypothetical protein
MCDSVQFQAESEDAPSAKHITPHLLAEALPVIHKYCAAGFEKFACNWFQHVLEAVLVGVWFGQLIEKAFGQDYHTEAKPAFNTKS